MTSPLDIQVATTLSNAVRTFETSRQGSASGKEFEWSLYNALLDIRSWEHAAGPDQFDMALSISSQTGTRYEFDGVFASSDTMYVIEAKRLSGSGLGREHVGIFVQKLLDTMLGSYDEIGHRTIKPVIVCGLGNVDEAACYHAAAWGILLISPATITPFDILRAIQEQGSASPAVQELAHDCEVLTTPLWRPLNDIIHPSQQSRGVFDLDSKHIYEASRTQQLVAHLRECAESACSLGLVADPADSPAAL